MLSPQALSRVLHRIADSHIGAIERAFLYSIKVAVDQVDDKALARALAAGDERAAFRALSINGQLEKGLKQRMAHNLSRVFNQAAQATEKLTPLRADTARGAQAGASLRPPIAVGQPTAPAMPTPLKAAMEFRFDIVNPRAVNWARNEAAQLVKQLGEHGQEKIRILIARGISEGRTARTTAKDLGETLLRDAKATLGLTKQQFGALEKQRAVWAQAARVRELRADGVEFDAVAEQLKISTRMARKLADMRIDREDVARRYEKLAAQKLRLRANDIGRTETITASAAGQREVWQQAQDDGFIRFAQDLPTQFTTPDGRLIDGPVLHPKCRCATATKRRADGTFAVHWVVTKDDRLCPQCQQMPGLNPDGIGLPLSAAQAIGLRAA